MEGEFAGDAESRERIIQAKRLWNLRWCHNWYNKKLEVEERLSRGRPVSPQDALKTSALATCVIQQVLQLTASHKDGHAEDTFGISETTVDDVSRPPAKKKYNLLKTPLHYIKILKNKVPYYPGKLKNKSDGKETVENAELLSTTLKASDEDDQAQWTGNPFDTSCDLINFVSRRAGNIDFGLFVLQCPACHFQQVITASGFDVADLLREEDSSEVKEGQANNWTKSVGSYKTVQNMQTVAKPVPKSPILRLSGERMHSRLCVYYIIGIIVRRITTSRSFHFLKQIKSITNNSLNKITFGIPSTMSPTSIDTKKPLHSSFSYPAQNLPHPYVMANREYGVCEMQRYDNNEYLRQRDELADLCNVSGGHMKDIGRSRVPDNNIIRPRPCATRRNYGFPLLNDTNKSKTL